MRSLSFRSAARVLKTSRTVFITVHQRPDGDALGSQLALAAMLRRFGVKVFCINEDPVPERYDFLPRVHTVSTSPPPRMPERFDTAIALECADLGRAGKCAAYIKRADRVINMDHHLNNAFFGDVNLVDPTSPATVLLVEALRARLKSPLTREIALNLYVGLFTETGGFRYSNTTPEVLRFASRLIVAGVDPKWVGDKVYERQPLKRMKLLARALSTLGVRERVAWMSVSLKDFAASGAEEDDAEDFVEYPRMVNDVDVAVFLRETARNVIRVSLRTKAGVPVNRIAACFSGGGHSYAAGCTLRGTGLEAARKRLAPVVRRYIRQRRGKNP